VLLYSKEQLSANSSCGKGVNFLSKKQVADPKGRGGIVKVALIIFYVQASSRTS